MPLIKRNLLAISSLIILISCGQKSDSTSDLSNVVGKPEVIQFLETGKCLDIVGQSKENGARLHQWDCHSGNSQKFYLYPIKDYKYKGGVAWEMVSAHSGKCVTVDDHVEQNGAQLSLWDCAKNLNQIVQPMSVTMDAKMSLRFIKTEYYIDTAGENFNGARVITKPFTGSRRHQVNFIQ